MTGRPARKKLADSHKAHSADLNEGNGNGNGNGTGWGDRAETPLPIKATMSTKSKTKLVDTIPLHMVTRMSAENGGPKPDVSIRTTVLFSIHSAAEAQSLISEMCQNHGRF
ncbi:hypothetical protein D6T64_03190 [Cryobacterium melibiosiphilum]|uniref:Uncharacterized protein n=1 Tax=Cryobacterium melibiosiphilum TaxID=995039 RepID=A0A3A5MU64_9MICO|nr:hypothetical protein [Cryobacterium melibiosiphilum]RJT90753.1 hypothetical protein D6T64_03190 [Cryobacterium melibiosiphilum]